MSAAAPGPAWAARAAQAEAAGAAGADGLVHGMGKELAEPDWAPLTAAEVVPVLARYGLPGPGHVVAGAAVTWRSPRPMSAAGLVRQAGGDVFVKRHDPRVRSAAQLAAEHAFIAHLRARGFPVPAVRRTRDGVSAVRSGGFVYEVHDVAAGIDLYRDAVSWSPWWTPPPTRTLPTRGTCWVMPAGSAPPRERRSPGICAPAGPGRTRKSSPAEPAPSEMVRRIRDNRGMKVDMSTVAGCCPP